MPSARTCCSETMPAITSSRLNQLSFSSASATLQCEEKNLVPLQAGLEEGSTYLSKVALKPGHQCWEASSPSKPTQTPSAQGRRQRGAPWGSTKAPHPQLLAGGSPSPAGLLSWCFASGKLRWNVIKDGRIGAENRAEGSSKALPT